MGTPFNWGGLGRSFRPKVPARLRRRNFAAIAAAVFPQAGMSPVSPPLCLFDQRLLHACEAGIQPAVMTENSITWMLLMKNLPISSLPVRLAGQAPTAASLLAVFVMGTPTKAETPKEEDSSGPCRYDHFWVKSQ